MLKKLLAEQLRACRHYSITFQITGNSLSDSCKL
jgi:hypothetical protein